MRRSLKTFTMFDLEKNTIFQSLHGSRAYGTNTEASDIDIKGVAVPPKSYFLGFAEHYQQSERKIIEPSEMSVIESVIYDIRKFCKLAADCNPNIIEVLFVSDGDVQKCTPAGEILRGNAHLFLSKKAKYTFSGYAFAQLKRIKLHRRWLTNDKPWLKTSTGPSREEFGLSDMKISNDLLGENYENLPGGLVAVLQKEKQFLSARKEWESYNNWKQNRNKSRSEMEEKFGYDCKHAMHLVRLMRMCCEILEGKGVIVKRPDAAELLEIRNGKLTYDELIEQAETMEARATSLYESSSLQRGPDLKKLDALCIEVVEKHLASK